MRIIQLVYLLDLYKTHSLSKTANNFFVSRQTISYDLKKLEETYMIKIYEYNNNKIKFTPDGELMVLKAKNIVDAYTDFENIFPSKNDDTLCSGNIKLFTTPRIANSFLPLFLKDFLRQYPFLKVAFYQNRSQDIKQNILLNSGSLGIVTSNNKNFSDSSLNFLHSDNNSNINVIPLATMSFFVCVYSDTPWNDIDYFTLDSLSKYPLIGYKDVYSNMNNDNLRYTYTVSDAASQRKLIAEGLGVGILTSAEYTLLYKNKKKYILKPLFISTSDHIPVQLSYFLLAQSNRAKYEDVFIEKLLNFFQNFDSGNTYVVF